MVSYSKFLKVLLSFSISLSPVMFINSANASTLAGGSGWRVASTVANGVGVTVNGVKDVMVNGAKKTMTGVANVTPTAGQVGNFMGKNLGAAAVIGAMDLLLDGVDYVLDPANNSVIYKTKPNTNCEDGSSCPSLQYVYQNSGKYFSTAQAAAQITIDALIADVSTRSYSFKSTNCPIVLTSPINCSVIYNADHNQPYTYNVSVSVVINPAYDPANTGTDNGTKTFPLVNLGSQVLDKAEEELRTGNPAAPIATPVTQAAATAVVGEAATDDVQARPIVTELDKSAAIPTTETAVGEISPPTTNPDTGEVNPGSMSLDFPVFCSWAPSMCVLADKVQEAITDAREWVKESETTDTELEIPEPEQQETDTNINFNGSCPAKITLVNFNYHNNQQNWEVDFTEWCSAVTTYIRPIVISMGAFSAVLIVSGVRINE
ncbi:MAG: hypothetical protein A3F63_16070 [Pseudomonadales bacterium RIFCSPHIGHO2_12_FULL_40_16]|nr:MAG: hypothetical protein A2W44_04235 [Acinetobacter sp. RIFCSPHIGHO2_12_41_5]OHC20285.1 MAG: hypothetical protein A3F63_16070 [Pseudomonadales bacterium RIFCSPHIGHO2_12_FULL_40_16]